jgi:putative molybdopterin biosynthesis protein
VRTEKDQPQRLGSTAHFKVLGDPRRLAILRLLMAEPATLTQLGKALGDHPAKVRHHLKQLENAGLVNLISTKIVGGFVEKYYAASARAYLVNLALLPHDSSRQSLCLMGSHDIALSILAQRLRESKQPVDLVTISVGSLDGLIALRQGMCQLAGAHLPDSSVGKFNQDYVRHLFPGDPITLVTLAHREQGLIVQEGNPLHITELADLGREEIRLINRQPGSGTRIWLDQKMESEGLDTESVAGYSNTVSTHLQVAETIAMGRAKAGIGLLAASRHYHNDFIPLLKERFDLVMFSKSLELPSVQLLLEQLNSPDFRRQVVALGGYDTSYTGEIRQIN